MMGAFGLLFYPIKSS
uniref:Uncharacterized protein n=1 Tax=Anguilla anguilla TaxID=7936 RepID=A0A0E9QVZ4_ANGAN